MPSPQQVMENLARQETQTGGSDNSPVLRISRSDVPGPDEPGVDTSGSDVPGPDEPGVDMSGSDAPGPDKTINVIAGFGILFLILLISTMYTVAPMLSGTDHGMQNVTIPYSSDPGDSQSKAIPKATATPVITPVIISPTSVATPVIISPTPVPTPAAPKSYITIEAVPVASPPILQDLTQDLPVPSTKDYFTVYSMNNQETVTTLPYVSFTLINPPLVIEYDVTPFNITEVKDVDYKILSTVYHEKLTLNRPYEQSWFRVVARDRDTGKVVAETGYGIQYSQETHGKIVVYKGGNYRFEFSGQYSRVSLTMKVKKEGNIESG